MPFSAWLMLAFGCVVLYGGLGYCIYIARRNSPKKISNQIDNMNDEL